MIKLILFLCFLLTIDGSSICYREFECFTDSKPFGKTMQRPFAMLPDAPEKVNVRFGLFNRKLGDKNETLSVYNISENLDLNIPIKFIIHGFLQNADAKWVIQMKDALIKTENVNVFTVDWRGGNWIPYMQATANTQIVGYEIANFVEMLRKEKGLNLTNVHLIGHSLGAHVAGYAGARLNGTLGRITGLDPAGLYFENTDPLVRLDPTDAQFVDVIHTDGASNVIQGFGFFQPSGHVDFYPNGGNNQPGCQASSDNIFDILFGSEASNINGFDEYFTCSHSAAINLFIDTILNARCKFISFSCISKTEFDNGNCLNCSSKSCNQMGYWSSSNKELGTLYLNTLPLTKTSFCKQHLLVTLVSSNNLNNSMLAKGQFNIYFETELQQSSIYSLDNSKTIFKPGSIEKRLIGLDVSLIKTIDFLYISYKKQVSILSRFLYDNKWIFGHVKVYRTDDQSLIKYCPSNNFILSENFLKFVKC